jgi:zinc transport system permease protein
MLLNFFSYDFLVRALVAGLVIGFIAPMLGSFLTVRRYSLIADTLSHASLAGVAIGVLLNVNPIVSAVVTAVILAIAIERLRSTGRFSGDSLLALVLTGSLAFAVVAMSAAHSFNTSILSYLFGSISTVSQTDMWTIIILGAVIAVALLVCFKKFFLIAFDEDVARAAGLRVTALNMLLAIMTAVTVAISMRVVGVLLVGALMVLPVLAAMQYERGFKTTTIVAVVISLLSVILGIFTSFSFDVATGGTIVLTALGFFLLSLVAHKVFV